MGKTLKRKCPKTIAGLFAAAAVAIASVFTLSGCGNNTESYDSISVKEIVGDVTVENKGDTYKAYQNMKLTDGFAMTTAAESYSGMMLDSEKYARLEENSRARFESTGSGGRSTSIVLEYGELYNEIMRPLNSSEAYTVTTPNAVLSVRGTIFVARVVKDSEGKETTEIFTFAGSVSTRRTAYEEDIIVKAGYKAVIQSDGNTTYYVREADEIANGVGLLKLSDIDINILVCVYAASKGGRNICFSNEDLEAEFKRRNVDITQYTSYLSGSIFEPWPSDSVVTNANAAEAAAVVAIPEPGADQAVQNAGEAAGDGTPAEADQGSDGDDGAADDGAADDGAADGGAADGGAADGGAADDGAVHQEEAVPAAPAGNEDQAAPAAQEYAAVQQPQSVTAAQEAVQQPVPAEQKQDNDKQDEQTPAEQKQEEKKQEEKSGTDSDKDKEQNQSVEKPEKEEKQTEKTDDKAEKKCEHEYRLGAVSLESGKGKDGTYTAKLTCYKCSESVNVTGEVGSIDFDSGNTVTYHIDFVYKGKPYPGTYSLTCSHNYFYQENDDPVFIWSADHSSCTARFECLNGCGAYIDVKCEIENDNGSITAWCDRGEITFSETYNGEGYGSVDDEAGSGLEIEDF